MQIPIKVAQFSKPINSRGYWRAVVAIAAKNARLCWAVLQRGDNFKIPA